MPLWRQNVVNFLALYRGRTLGDAQVVAVTSDPSIIAELAERLLAQPEEEQTDPVQHQLHRGRRQALAFIREEARDAPGRKV